MVGSFLFDVKLDWLSYCFKKLSAMTFEFCILINVSASGKMKSLQIDRSDIFCAGIMQIMKISWMITYLKQFDVLRRMNRA